MNHKAKYTLSVRGQEVTIIFSRINDSRRLQDYRAEKKPNLFNIRGAMECTLVVPFEMSPYWWKIEGKPCYLTGYAFCTRLDKWKSQAGRQHALEHAMRNVEDKELRLEIWTAFKAEEKARTKTKGPAHTPKTAKPKVRKARTPIPGSICELLGRIATALEMKANPMQSIESRVKLSEEEWNNLARVAALHDEFHPPVGTAAKPEENTL